MADQKKKYGFKDNRTPAEIALAPAKPAGREAPSAVGVKKGGVLGTIAKAALMSSATYGQFKARSEEHTSELQSH